MQTESKYVVIISTEVHFCHENSTNNQLCGWKYLFSKELVSLATEIRGVVDDKTATLMKFINNSYF